MEVAMGRIPANPVPWGDADNLEQRLATAPLPPDLWLASRGPRPALNRKLQPFVREVERNSYRCFDRPPELSHGRLLQCQSAATVPR